jgi:hypothetical protein
MVGELVYGVSAWGRRRRRSLSWRTEERTRQEIIS